jgi:hypothetical protein
MKSVNLSGPALILSISSIMIKGNSSWKISFNWRVKALDREGKANKSFRTTRSSKRRWDWIIHSWRPSI